MEKRAYVHCCLSRGGLHVKPTGPWTHRFSCKLRQQCSYAQNITHTHSAIWTLKETWIYGCEGSGLKRNGYVCCKHMHAHWFGAFWGMCPLKNVWFTVDVTVQHVGKMDYMFPCTKLKSLGKIAVWKFEKEKRKSKERTDLGQEAESGPVNRCTNHKRSEWQEIVWWMNEWMNKQTKERRVSTASVTFISCLCVIAVDL